MAGRPAKSAIPPRCILQLAEIAMMEMKAVRVVKAAMIEVSR